MQPWSAKENIMWEFVVGRCYAKKVFLKNSQNHIEKTALEFLSNTVKGLQTVRLTTVLKRDPSLVSQNQPFVDALQDRWSWAIHKTHRKVHVLKSLFNWCLEAFVHRLNKDRAITATTFDNILTTHEIVKNDDQFDNIKNFSGLHHKQQ